MSTTAPVTWFELAQRVAESHARHALASVAVIPIVVENLHAARPMLSALAEVHEGCFLDASDQGADSAKRLNVYEPVPGTADHLRREAIEAAFSDLPKPIKVVERVDALLDISFDSPGVAAAPSAGDRTLHAIARAVAHELLDELSFAIIAYSSGTLDERARRAAWNLMVHHLHKAPRKSPQTLVVVVQSGISVDLHCQTEYGFRFAIDQGELLYRRGASHLRLAATRIVEQSKKAPLVFFLRAGFSVSSRMPLGDQLRDNAILRILNDSRFESLDSTELGMEFHNLLSSMGGGADWLSVRERSMNSRVFATELTLERVLAVEKRMNPELPTLLEFKEHHDTIVSNPGPSVRILAEILRGADTRVVIFQLNFDCLVERNAKSRMKVFASGEEFRPAADYVRDYCMGKESDIPLLKLHGSIEAFDTCIVTQEETDRGIGEAQFQTLTSMLEISGGRLPWIYVGMSMRDRDLLQVLSGQQFAKRLDELWVVPYLVPSVRAFGKKREPHWTNTELGALEDRVIAETSDSFFEALQDVWPT